MQERFTHSTNENLVEHLIIPTSIPHHYDGNEGQVTRNAVYMKKYGSQAQGGNPIIFFHGGPLIVNKEQYSDLTNYFTQKGHAVYIPEIEGSGMYYKESNWPVGFDPSLIPTNLELLSLNKYWDSGLNEFIKNYAFDIKDIINHITELHPDTKISIVAHSLGCHHLLRSLQFFPELNQKIAAITNIAGTYDYGVNRFWRAFDIWKEGDSLEHSQHMFYTELELQSKTGLKSRGNQNQAGPSLSATNNPSINLELNKEVSVHYGDLSHFPPMLLLHATDDEQVFFQSSILLAKKIKNQGNCLIKELYFESGGHQFIKNEGSLEIKEQAFKAIEIFFNNPEKIISKDWSHFKFADVFQEHSLFLENQDHYFHSRFTLRSDKLALVTIPKIADVVSIQNQIRGFLDRKKYTISQLLDKELTRYPAFAIGNDPEIISLKKYQQPGRIAILSTSGLRAIKLACQLKKQNEAMTLEQKIDKSKVPLILIMDNSKSVYQFWKNLQAFMQDNNKTASEDLCLANLTLFLEESEPLYVLKGISLFSWSEQKHKHLYDHLRRLFFDYGYEFIRTMICNALLFRQSWTDTDSFIKLKNILAYREIEHIYVHPSNLISLIPAIEDRKKIISNIKVLDPVVSIHSSFCKKHDTPEKILFFSRESEETMLKDASFPLCYSDIDADSVIKFIKDYRPCPTQFYQYLMGLKQEAEWRYDINEFNYQGENALLSAAQTGNAELLDAIIKMGAYVNYRNFNFDSAFTVALKNNHFELVKILVEQGYILDHPFDKPFIENSPEEIRNYLKCQAQLQSREPQLPPEKAFSFLSLEEKQRVQEAILVVRNTTNFPQSCDAELKFLEKTTEAAIVRNCYETTQWLLGTNLICLNRLTKGTHKSGWNFHQKLSYNQLMHRKNELFNVLIAYGDSLKCIDPRGMDNSDERYKPKPIAIICRSEIAKLLNQIQDERFSKLKEDLKLEEVEELDERDNNENCSLQ
ncbi:MAG: hypothetical protein H0U70_02235 [Tatlockia sp.]|nr:hypothetical protein [Tatlockia sp.]